MSLWPKKDIDRMLLVMTAVFLLLLVAVGFLMKNMAAEIRGHGGVRRIVVEAGRDVREVWKEIKEEP